MSKILVAAVFCLAFAGTINACPRYQNLSVLSPDTDPDIHDVVTYDIWAVWYHPLAYTKDDALFVARRLEKMRCAAVNDFGMIDPTAAFEGYYTNVILHVTDDDIVQDAIPNDWGSAVGKNDDGYSQMELDEPVPFDLYTLDHEGFHVMQDQVANRYESVAAGSYWIAEASADWFAWNLVPNSATAFDAAASIVATPHLPFWSEWQTWPRGKPFGNVVFTRPYALHALLVYLQRHTPMTRREISQGYYRGDNTPREVFVETLGFDGFANSYADFNAKLTAMMILGNTGRTLSNFVFTGAQRREAVAGLEDYFGDQMQRADRALIRPVAASIDMTSDLQNWTQPRRDARPYGWGYNVIAIENPSGTPILEFEGEEMRLRLVTLQGQSWRIEEVNDGDTMDLAGVSNAYLVVTSTPQLMNGYDRYTYRLRLSI
ncbi:hypothetical protein [Pseudooctadecabacter jejudonensis]|uniref:Uncharacterized protein n=1 Tax=Pseudooctadecabacter jejudonensis TaxID=1391910 RepID=A0A1Y5SSA5_9RHOB|nr:hypothetical protein [Pseudooctadecabacter jejudonensis]SLN47196.1 hypothetical protein PSJ8397_02473 [Pseudooctadecabacter jejudonensis]